MEKKQYGLLPAIMLVTVTFLLGTCELAIVGILPDISGGFDIPLTSAGSLVSVFAISYALGTPFCSAAAGNIGKLRSLMLCLIIFAASNLACALTDSYGIFAVSRAVTAVAAGTSSAIALSFAGDITTPEHTPGVISLIFSGYSIAAVLGVPMASVLTGTLGWRAAFAAFCALALIAAVILYRILPHTAGTASVSILRQFAILKNRTILLTALCAFFSFASIYTVYTYLTPLLEDVLHIEPGLVSIILMLYGCAAFLSNLLSGRLAHHGGMRCMPTVFLVNIICMLVMPLALHNLYTGLANIFLMGILMYVMNSPGQITFLNTAADKYPGCVGLASSLECVFANLGIAFGSYIGGAVADLTGIMNTGIMGALFALTAFICSSVLSLMLSGRRIRSPHTHTDLKGFVSLRP